MTKRPFTDLHDIIKEEMCEHMKPFMDVMLHEHEETRRGFKDLAALVNKIHSSRTHNFIQDVFIAAIIVGMILIITGCLIT